MAIQYIQAQDAIGANESKIPMNVLACGYTTGSGVVPWTLTQFAARTKPYPPVRICQDAGASDATADVLDVESGAATVEDIPGWIKAARANYNKVARLYQRWPMIYCSMGTLTAAVDILQSNKITNVPFWTAEPGNTVAYAASRITSATGSYPCQGVQYSWGNTVDYDAFNLDWIKTMANPESTPKPTYVPMGPPNTTQGPWRHCIKCQGLFWGPNTKESRCPAGGTHDMGDSWAYVLPAKDK